MVPAQRVRGEGGGVGVLARDRTRRGRTRGQNRGGDRRREQASSDSHAAPQEARNPLQPRMDTICSFFFYKNFYPKME